MISIRAEVKKSNDDIPPKAPFPMKYGGVGGKIDSIECIGPASSFDELDFLSTSQKVHTARYTLFLPFHVSQRDPLELPVSSAGRAGASPLCFPPGHLWPQPANLCG
jgi:hypothetical protein